MLRNKNYVYGANTAMVPAHMHFGLLMLETCKRFGDATALLDADTGAEMTYNEVAQLAVDVALSLSRVGVGKGDVVSVCSEKRMEFMPTMIGVMCAGATFTTADVSCRNATILHRINMTSPRMIFCSSSMYEVHMETFKSVNTLEAVIVYGDEEVEGAKLFRSFLTEHASVDDFIPSPVDGWSDVAVIMCSSGTTGVPKGVKLTHLNFLLCHQHGLTGSNFTGTRMLSTREWYYTYGLKHSIGTLLVGATVVFTSGSDVKDFLNTIQKYKINVIQLVPHTIQELVNSPLHEYDVSSLMWLTSTSTPLDAELVKRAREKFPNLQPVSQMYGMTEAGCLCDDFNSPKGSKPGSVGCVNPGVIIKVVDLESRQPLGANKIGEICFKSHSLMPGYVGEDVSDYLDDEGFFKSGDVGYYDEDKYFFIVDRMKDLIKYKGATASPAEIESVLLQHPAVREAGVVGAAHPEYGYVPAAFVVADDQVTEGELIEFVNGQLTTIYMEGGIRFVSKLPRGAGTKINRKALKEML